MTTTISGYPHLIFDVFMPDFEHGAAKFTVVDDRTDESFSGVVANESDLTLIASALENGIPFQTSENGLIAICFEDRIQVGTGQVQHTLDTDLEQWWEILIEAPNAIATFFEAVHHLGITPSTAYAGDMLVSSSDYSGWLCPIGLSEMAKYGTNKIDWIEADHNYGGHSLVCPQNHNLRLAELCGEPGAYYGPWRIMHNGVIGGANTFEECDAMVKKMLENGIPDPLPDWRSDATMVVELPKGLTAVVRPEFSTRDDIWTETYDVEIIDHNHNLLYMLNLGESLEEVLRLRDDPDFLARIFQRPTTLVPDFKPEEDNSDKRKPLPILPEFKYYADENSVEHHRFDNGIEVTITNNIPIDNEDVIADHCKADIRFSDRLTLRLLAFRIEEAHVSFEVLLDGKVVNDRPPLWSQGLEPILRRVLRGDINEKLLLNLETPEFDDIPF